MRFKQGLARSRQFSDAHEAASALPGVSMEMAMVDRATGGWNVAELDLGHLRLLRVEAGGAVSATGAVDENVFSFALPMGGGESAAWTVNGCAGGRDQLTMFAPGATYTLFTPGALSWLALRVDEQFFRRRFHAIFGRRLAACDVRVVTCGQRNARRLRRAHHSALALLDDSRTLPDERSLRRLEEGIVTSLLRALAGGQEETERVRALPSRLRRILRADAEGPVDLDRLRSGLGTSERTLRRTFRQLLGVSPARYLRVRRLHQARNALKALPDRTVTQVAVSLGFSDLGRFARDYRQLFGELPSATLKRSRAAPHRPN